MAVMEMLRKVRRTTNGIRPGVVGESPVSAWYANARQLARESPEGQKVIALTAESDRVHESGRQLRLRRDAAESERRSILNAAQPGFIDAAAKLADEIASIDKQLSGLNVVEPALTAAKTAFAKVCRAIGAAAWKAALADAEVRREKAIAVLNEALGDTPAGHALADLAAIDAAMTHFESAFGVSATQVLADHAFNRIGDPE